MATSTLPLSTFVALPSSPPISKSTTYLLFLPLPPSPAEGFPRRIRCRNPAASRAAVRVFCGNRGNSHHREGLFKEFSVLPPDSSWDEGDVWYIFGAYLFTLHVPLSFGGIAAVSKILRTPVVDPLTEAAWALILQTMEFMAVLILLNHTAKSEFGLPHILTDRSISKGRNWIMASVVGLGVLVLLVVITSFLADQLIGTKDVNDPVVQEMMISSSASKAVCFLVYCFSTPLLEELVYRRFLLRSLATTMNWQNAVLVTSVVFSMAHFSSTNALQLFVIGSVLGSVYCWLIVLKESNDRPFESFTFNNQHCRGRKAKEADKEHFEGISATYYSKKQFDRRWTRQLETATAHHFATATSTLSIAIMFVAGIFPTRLLDGIEFEIPCYLLPDGAHLRLHASSPILLHPRFLEKQAMK